MNSPRVKIILNLLLAAGIVTALEVVQDLIRGSHVGFAANVWGFVSDFLIVVAMMLYVTRSPLTGIRLLLSAFVISYGIGCFNILIEALIFNVTDQAETWWLMATGVLHFFVLSGATVYLFRQTSSPPQQAMLPLQWHWSWLWRLPVAIVLYLFCYITAGLILQASLPALMEFYDDKIPPLGLIFGTQILRAIFFSGIAVLMLATTSGRLFWKALLIGLIFSFLGGIAPLIPINPFMPYEIRVGHGFEVGISNFIYGVALGFLLNPLFRRSYATSPASGLTGEGKMI